MKKSITGLGIGFMLCMVSPTQAEEPEFRWSSGIDYSRGNYSDTQTTDILYVPFSGRVLFGGFEAKVTVPYIRIEGPGTVVGGGEVGPINPGRDAVAAITTEDGIGDVTTSLTWTHYAQDNTLFVGFTGKAKLPTASSEKRLGTGETDFTTQIDLTKVTGNVNWFATAGYRFMGSSAALPLRSGFIGSFGASVNVSERTSAGLIYDYRRSASVRASDPSEVTGFISWKLTDKINLQTYGVVGFSDGSPDGGGGVQISFRQ